MNYSINQKGDVVVSWSSKRLPFEPKGWQATYRDELRAALATPRFSRVVSCWSRAPSTCWT